MDSMRKTALLRMMYLTNGSFVHLTLLHLMVNTFGSRKSNSVLLFCAQSAYHLLLVSICNLFSLMILYYHNHAIWQHMSTSYLKKSWHRRCNCRSCIFFKSISFQFVWMILLICSSSVYCLNFREWFMSTKSK